VWISRADNDGTLDIVSISLSALEMMESEASAVTLHNTLKSTVGMVSPKIKNPRVVWPNIKNATSPL
jgi:hypothetical protein